MRGEAITCIHWENERKKGDIEVVRVNQIKWITTDTTFSSYPKCQQACIKPAIKSNVENRTRKSVKNRISINKITVSKIHFKLLLREIFARRKKKKIREDNFF